MYRNSNQLHDDILSKLYYVFNGFKLITFLSFVLQWNHFCMNKVVADFKNGHLRFRHLIKFPVDRHRHF